MKLNSNTKEIKRSAPQNTHYVIARTIYVNLKKAKLLTDTTAAARIINACLRKTKTALHINVTAEEIITIGDIASIDLDRSQAEQILEFISVEHNTDIDINFDTIIMYINNWIEKQNR